MPFLPAVIPQFHLTDKPFLIATTGHCDPLQSIWRLDFIPVTPVIFCILKIVMEYEDINTVNDVEIALPRHVIGLQDCSFHNRYTLFICLQKAINSRLSYHADEHFCIIGLKKTLVFAGALRY